MKKYSFTFTILFLSFLAMDAQQWGGTNNQTANISRTGNVGIGTAALDGKLTVGGNVNIGGTAGSSLKVRIINGKRYNSTAVDHLYLNYNNGKNVYAGYGATRSSLFVGTNLYVGAAANGLVRSRHIQGKAYNSTAVDNLYLNYNTGKNVYVGYGGKTSNLLVNGETYVNGGWVRVYGNKGLYFQNNGGGLYMKDATWIRTYGNKSFYHNTGIFRTDGTLQAGPNGSRLLVKTDGKVGINTTTPDYRLDVNGTIRAKEVRVQTGWSDHVFLPDYQLPTLKEEEQFINDNGHLIGFESEKEMDGEVKLAEVTNQQQETIEKLMLHVIELDKKFEAMNAKNQKLEAENQALKQAVQEIIRK